MTSRAPIAKVIAGFAVGLAAVGLVLAADLIGVDLRAPAAALLAVVLSSAAAYVKDDPRVDERSKEPNGAALREPYAD